MKRMNTVCITGRFTKDPEVKQTPSNISVVSFSLAVDRDYATNGERVTDFIDCVAWRKTAEFIGNYFSKGKEVAVVGTLQTRSFDDQKGNKRKVTEVVVEKVNFIGSRNEPAQAADPEPQQIEEAHLPFDVM